MSVVSKPPEIQKTIEVKNTAVMANTGPMNSEVLDQIDEEEEELPLTISRSFIEQQHSVASIFSDTSMAITKGINPKSSIPDSDFEKQSPLIHDP